MSVLQPHGGKCNDFGRFTLNDCSKAGINMRKALWDHFDGHSLQQNLVLKLKSFAVVIGGWLRQILAYKHGTFTEF